MSFGSPFLELVCRQPVESILIWTYMVDTKATIMIAVYPDFFSDRKYQ
jgi:hypothetical protein